MERKLYPVIDMEKTGRNIMRLRQERGMTVRDLQVWFGFAEPQAIYRWQSGKTLPSVDNLYALSTLLEVPMEDILVPRAHEISIYHPEQQAETCCSHRFGWVTILPVA